MQRVSEYFQRLSTDAKARYTSKVTSIGLSSDPYALPSSFWQNELDCDAIPCVKWSDMFLYLVMTPSQYTREEIKVKKLGSMKYIE